MATVATVDPDALAAAIAAAAAALQPTPAPVHDEFDSFASSPSSVLINPTTKLGLDLFRKASELTITPDQRLTGADNEQERLFEFSKDLLSRINVQGVLSFSHSGKDHDIINAPENTSLDELLAYSNDVIFGYDGTSTTDGEMIRFSQQPRGTDDEKQKLRKAIDLRARNQVIFAYCSKMISPTWLSTLINNPANRKYLIRKDHDSTKPTFIDGAAILLLIFKQICPSVLSLVDNLKNKASKLDLKDFNNDVSALITKFEEHLLKIELLGGDWSEKTKTFFTIMSKCPDENFAQSMRSTRNDYYKGKLTGGLSAIIQEARDLYTNLSGDDLWMKPDEKSLKIAALTTQLQNLQKSVASSKSALTTDSGFGTDDSKKSFSSRGGKNQIADWRFKYQGKDI